MFCSEECKKKVALFHLNDGTNEAYTEEFARLTLKMLFEAFRTAGGVDDALELLKDSEDKTIFDFDFSNPEDPNKDKNKLIALNGLGKRTKCHEMIEIKPDQLLDISPINEKKRTAQERKSLLNFIIGQFEICVSNTVSHQDLDHLGIFLFKSLINHSCAPNLMFLRFNDKVFSMVCRPIKAGEQVLSFYSVQAGFQSKADRHKHLQNYKFTCECEACINDWPQQFPRKDPLFVEPKLVAVPQAEAFEQFKKNCKYIDKNAWKLPCYEVQAFIAHNALLIACIAGRKLPDI